MKHKSKNPYQPTPNKHTKNILLALLLGLLLVSLSSCSVLSHVGNPPPDMKTVHMSTVHWNYTQEDYDNHPEQDCHGTFKTKQDEQSEDA